MSRPDAWRTRKSRKRGFDDDNHEEPSWPSIPLPSFHTPERAPQAGGPEVEATVRWFNPEKGFGFVEVAGGGGDAFLHGSVLSRAGATSVNPGATLKVRLAPSQKGPQVTEVTDIKNTPAPAAGSSGASAGGHPGGARSSPSLGDAQEVLGVVKWYNAEKGFGFVAPESGGKDVFMHATAIARGGATQVTDGTPVRMQVAQGKKGPEAVSVSNR
jgi:CspA family cold shock protein